MGGRKQQLVADCRDGILYFLILCCLASCILYPGELAVKYVIITFQPWAVSEVHSYVLRGLNNQRYWFCLLFNYIYQYWISSAAFHHSCSFCVTDHRLLYIAYNCRAGSEATYSCRIELGVSVYVYVYLYLYICISVYVYMYVSMSVTLQECNYALPYVSISCCLP